DSAWQQLVQANGDPRLALQGGVRSTDPATGRPYITVNLWTTPARPPAR
ncbi:MAG: hypothetical protein INR62_13995, partial [Rhodospirillales bacterium]|nr:hypothetical protein [Acetobacter sp.]